MKNVVVLMSMMIGSSAFGGGVTVVDAVCQSELLARETPASRVEIDVNEQAVEEAIGQPVEELDVWAAPQLLKISCEQPGVRSRRYDSRDDSAVRDMYPPITKNVRVTIVEPELNLMYGIDDVGSIVEIRLK